MTPYDFVYLAAAPLLLPVLAWKAWRRGKYRESAPAMLGLDLAKEDPKLWSGGCIWVHAVSVGETVAAQAMLPLLRDAYPDLPILLTTVTETGQARARATFEGKLASAVRYFPADFSWVVRRFLATYRPRVLVLMETELWPNVLNLVARSGIPIVVMNGKISERSYRGYNRFRSLLRKPLGRVSAWCMQTEGDAARIGRLIGDGPGVHVTGNCKFDVPNETITGERRLELRQMLGLQEKARAVVAGSTHPGEEEVVIRAMRELKQHIPEAVILLVPRHPERFSEVWDFLAHSGLSVRRLSDGSTAGEAPADIVLVDRMGILSELYGVGEVAVVAGSLVPGIGGHNLLEAAVHGIPVVYGPWMYGQPDMVRILDEENGGTRSTPEELAGCLTDLMTNPALAREKGRLGREAVLRNRGAAHRNLDILKQLL